MKLLTVPIAKKKSCPHFSAVAGQRVLCNPDDCMAWEEMESLVEREDHSGGRDVLNECASRRRLDCPGVEIQRKGGPGSTGILFIEARGVCRKLYPRIN